MPPHVPQVQSFRHSDRTENSVSTFLQSPDPAITVYSTPVRQNAASEFLRQVLRNYLLEFSAVTMDDPALVRAISQDK